ncbi:unnamed protein product [Closterium sp. Yama58-4]|nr:unnamed protein product [Closterium sp. Yama58-4]
MASPTRLPQGALPAPVQRRGSAGSTAGEAGDGGDGREGGEGEEGGGAVRWRAQGKRERSRRKARGVAMDDILRRTPMLAARGLVGPEGCCEAHESSARDGQAVLSSAQPARHDGSTAAAAVVERVREAHAGGEAGMHAGGDAGMHAAAQDSETALWALGVAGAAGGGGQGGGVPFVPHDGSSSEVHAGGAVEHEPLITYSLKRHRKSLNKEHN